MLAGLSRARALQGFTPIETATFILSFEKPLFEWLREAHAGDPAGLAEDLWRSTALLDRPVPDQDDHRGQ